MGYHNRRNPRDALESLHQNNRRLSDAVERMAKKTTHTVQINDIAGDEVQDPIEGEVRIDHTDNKIAWRVNDAWHKPSGDVVFAALYDDFIIGQWVGDSAEVHAPFSQHNVRLVFPFGHLSENAAGTFEFFTTTNTEYDIEEVRLNCFKNGIYTVSWDLDWDPDHFRTHVRFYIHEPDAPPAWDFPGRLVLYGGPWADHWRDAEGLNQWYGPWIGSFTTYLDAPGSTFPQELGFGFVGYDWDDPGTLDSIIGAKRVWVTYHGDPGLQDEYNPGGF